MMPDGDTTAHLRKQVGGLFFADHRLAPASLHLGRQAPHKPEEPGVSFVRAVSSDLADHKERT